MDNASIAGLVFCRGYSAYTRSDRRGEVMFTTLFRRSLENPRTPLSHPDAWLIEAWGGGAAQSGVRVNATTALTYSPVWRAVNLISRDVAKLPLVVYRRLGSGKEKDPAHPAFPLLRYKPHRELTSFPFRMTITANALLWGNGYALIERDGGARPVGLFLLNPEDTAPDRDPISNEIFYKTKVLGRDFEFARENILHIRGLGNGLHGMSVIAKARETFGLGIAARDYGSVFFKNNARPGMVLEHPGTMSDEAVARLKQSWQETQGGLTNAHKIAILEEGMKANPFSMSNEDAQFLGTREFEIREVANWFGVPPHKLGDTTRTAFASLEQENQSYLDDALDPWLVNWEMECWDKLLTERQKLNDTHVVEFTRHALVRANIKDRGDFYNQALQSGWMNRDEVRARENMNPIPDGEGEKFFMPLNMGRTGEEEEPQGDPSAPPAPTTPPPTENERSLEHTRNERDLLAEVFSRMAKRLSKNARRISKKPDDFIPWIEEEMDREHRAIVLSSFETISRILSIDTECAADEIFRRYNESLMEITDCRPTELYKIVKLVTDKLEKTMPIEAAERLLESRNGKAFCTD
jgi:HK97 family phage portal protein